MGNFVDELRETKIKFPSLRYGQIINNALQMMYGRKGCDCESGGGRVVTMDRPYEPCSCPNASGAAYDTFHISDSDLAAAIKKFREATR